MNTLLSILGIILVLLFLKFVWDSYITGNTEREWGEYKQQFPAEAERIESNSGLNFNRTPYDHSHRTKLGDLKHRIPNFMAFYSQLHPSLLTKVAANDTTRFEFKMPIRIYGNTVGYNHVGIMDRNGVFEMYFYTLSERGKKLSLEPHISFEDLSVFEYEEVLNKNVQKMMSNPDYMKIATGFS